MFTQKHFSVFVTEDAPKLKKFSRDAQVYVKRSFCLQNIHDDDSVPF